MSDPDAGDLLSRGVIASHLSKGLLPPADQSVFRVLGTRPVNDKSGAASQEKFRLALSDGRDKFTQAMVVLPEGGAAALPRKDQVLDVRNEPGISPVNVIHTINGKHLFIVHNFRVGEFHSFFVMKRMSN